MTRNLNDWLTLYAESHQHPVNQLLHTICVPLIVFSILGLLAEIPLPMGSEHARAAIPVVLLCIIFYWQLSIRYAVIMLAAAIIMLLIIGIWQNKTNNATWPWMLIIFIIAWIGQFIGHHIEGKKPSFFQDLQFLLIGPLWVIAKIEKKFI